MSYQAFSAWCFNNKIARSDETLYWDAWRVGYVEAQMDRTVELDNLKERNTHLMGQVVIESSNYRDARALVEKLKLEVHQLKTQVDSLTNSNVRLDNLDDFNTTRVEALKRSLLDALLILQEAAHI